MTTHTTHRNGTFSWVDLQTTDPAAAKKFYGGLFGWEFADLPMGDGQSYAMAKLGNKDVCGLGGLPNKQIPPHWNNYITVDDVDALVKKAATSGGKIIEQPFDVMDAGRMALVQDPSGAMICFWQPKKHIGAGVKNEAGALCWNELYTTNVDAAGKFYVSTLGWQTESMNMGPAGMYTLFQHAGEGKEGGNIGGMMNMPPSMKGAPSHWLPYFQVADCDASTKKAEGLGAKTLMPPMDIPNVGRFSIVQDPQGAVFALFKTTHY